MGGILPLFFDFDSLDHIGVVTGGSDPSLTTPGVTLNLVTKRGTNELVGSARVLYTDGVGWDYGVEAGGPLWKDRLWLWGAGASNSFLGEPVFLTGGGSFQSQTTFTNWNAKLNAELVAANSLTFAFRASKDPLWDGVPTGPLPAVELEQQSLRVRRTRWRTRRSSRRSSSRRSTSRT